MDVRALADPSVESGVAHGRVLLEFASAAVHDDDAGLARTRARLRAEMGDSGVADAAAVIANFERMVRIADAIGIELGVWMEAFTGDVRADLSLDRLRVRPEDVHEHECHPSREPAVLSTGARSGSTTNAPDLMPFATRSGT